MNGLTSTLNRGLSPHLFYNLCAAKQNQLACAKVSKPEHLKLTPSKLEELFLPRTTGSLPGDFLKFQVMMLVTLGVGPAVASLQQGRRLQKSGEIATLIQQMGISDTDDKNEFDELYRLSVAEVTLISLLMSWVREELHYDQQKIIDSTHHTAEAMLSDIDGSRSLVAKEGSLLLKDNKQNQFTALLSFGEVVSLCKIPLNDLDQTALRLVIKEQARKDAVNLFTGIVIDNEVILVLSR